MEFSHFKVIRMQPFPIAPAKDKYKVKNWKEYNASLCRRGQVTIWLENGVLREWRDIDACRRVVGEKTYPNAVILCCLTLGLVYGQKLRQTTGFVASLLRLMGRSDYAIPDYTTLCRRQSCLPVGLTERWQKGEKLDIAIDSTGLKVFGEGEWKVRRHGVSKRRTWRKLHMGIDVNTQEIVSVSLTGNNEDDAAVAGWMIEGKQDVLSSFRGDGAYDDFAFREKLGPNVVQIIPPPKDAVVHPGTPRIPPKPHLQQRNQAVEDIGQRGRKEWKVSSGYHKRSRNEVVMYRFKTAFGPNLNARKMENQKTEANIKAKVLNVWWDMGRPVSYKAS